jgi:5-formyltetrahydrofolate cyclo-ligase
VRDEKRRVRDAARAARTALSPAARAFAAQAVAERLLAMPETERARGVLAYAATSEEIDPSLAIEALRERGARIAFPRVCGPGEMTVHWAEASELQPGYCGLLEPAEGTEAAAAPDIDLVLVPGVAFDAQCHRLGMGSGFYDRFLAKLHPSARVIGIAFDEQVVEQVPCEEHDVPLDAVVTPTRTLFPTP